MPLKLINTGEKKLRETEKTVRNRQPAALKINQTVIGLVITGDLAMREEEEGSDKVRENVVGKKKRRKKKRVNKFL